MTYSYGPQDPQQPVVPAAPAGATHPDATANQAVPVPGQAYGAVPPLAAPTSAPPVSAPPTAYLPAVTSAPPSFTPGTGVATAPRRNVTLVLAIVSAVLLVVSGVTLALYLNQRSEMSETKATLQAQVKEQRDIVAQRDAKIAESEKSVADLTSELATTKTTLTTTTAERDVLLPCMRRVLELFDALDNKRPLTAIITQTDDACNKAENTVNR